MSCQKYLAKHVTEQTISVVRYEQTPQNEIKDLLDNLNIVNINITHFVGKKDYYKTNSYLY